VVKFAIGKVTVEGIKVFSTDNIRASIPELREGATPNFKAMAVQTAIANENSAKQVQVQLKESEDSDKIDANILVQEGSALSGAVNLANTGSDSTGNDRLALTLGHANLWNLDHQFSAAFTTSLERTEDVKQLGLNYRIPLYSRGAVLGLSYTNSDVVGNFGSFKSTGAGQTYGANYNHYLSPQGGYRGYASLALDEKVFSASKINGAVVPGQIDRNSRPLTLGYNARSESDAAVLGYGLDVAANLPGGTGNSVSAYQAEDARITSDHWVALHANLHYQSVLTAGWVWSTRLQMQYSPDALIAGEQMGLGGAASVRGTGERVISGDGGIASSFELVTPNVAAGLRLLGFVDAGWLISNNAAASTAGKSANDQLASVGVGARYAQGSLSVSAEWGHVVTAANHPVSGSTLLPKEGDEKLHVNMTVRF
jgi:hemolysin activation/secretion protein